MSSYGSSFYKLKFKESLKLDFSIIYIAPFYSLDVEQQE